MLPSRQDTVVGLWRKLVDNLVSHGGAELSSDTYDLQADLASKAAANLGAAYPHGPYGLRLRELVSASFAGSAAPVPQLPSVYDTESVLLSKACYNLGGGSPAGSAYDRLYALVQATHS